MTSIQVEPVCDRPRARAGLATVARARGVVLAATTPTGLEPVGLDAALGRALAEDVIATRDIPGYAGAAMDGYAVADPWRLRHAIVRESSTGGSPVVGVRPGEAMRIAAGAAIPSGASAVVPTARTVEDRGVLVLRGPVESGGNVRGAGEDLRAGTVVLRAGAALDAAALAVAAGAGRSAVLCRRRPTVALVCTGGEVVEPGAALRPGQILDRDAVALRHLTTACGAEVISVRGVGDEPSATAAAIDEGLVTADVVVTCGGVSAGVHDHVRAALERAGVATHFAGVALRPGKSALFGTRDRGLVFALPGNPVSAAVVFALFAAPALLAAQGLPPRQPVHAVLASPARRSPDRERALRVALRVAGGTLHAAPLGSQRSHVSSALLGADGLALIDMGTQDVAGGTLVRVLPLPGRCVL